MLPANTQTDPIVEILRLAYRRGLALRQEQAANKTAVSTNPGGASQSTAQQPVPAEVNHEQV